MRAALALDMRLVAIVVVCAASTARAEPTIASQYAPLFELGRTWKYTLTNTPFDLKETPKHAVWVPSKTKKERSTFTCHVAKVAKFKKAIVSQIECDRDIDSDYTFRVDGMWIATNGGIARDGSIDMPTSEPDISGLELVIAMSPKVTKTKNKTFYGTVITEVTNPAKGTWCTMTDTTDGADGAISEMCFTAGVGISSAHLDYYGGDPRLLDYAVAQP